VLLFLNDQNTFIYYKFEKVYYYLFIYILFPALSSGVGGAALLYAVTPSAYRNDGHLGSLFLHEEIDAGVAVVIEVVLTYQFIFVVISSTDPIRNMTGFQAPFAIGLSVGIGLLMGVSCFFIQILNFANLNKSVLFICTK